MSKLWLLLFPIPLPGVVLLALALLFGCYQ